MAYSTIPKGSLYMNNVLWTGNNTARTITGVGFQPDFTWIKSRTQAYNHILTDVLRGTTKYLSSNTNTVETTDAQTLTAFASDGFSIGTSNLVNQNVQDHVAWNWKGGGTGSANTDGSINSTVSANTTAGISISQYTGNATDNASVGHGLGTAPKMLIIKEITSTSNWGVWHQDLTDGGYRLSLQETTAQVSDTAFMGGGNRAIPTNSVFYLGSGGGGNSSSDNYIAYAFSEIKGFSKMGSYTGNGNADGPFVYTGFSPSFIMGKRTDGTGPWWMLDNKRDGYNVTNRYLLADDSRTEGTDPEYNTDFLSNGWKTRYNNGNYNASGGTYIYMAFAENPFVATSGTSAIPVTAR